MEDLRRFELWGRVRNIDTRSMCAVLVHMKNNASEIIKFNPELNIGTPELQALAERDILCNGTYDSRWILNISEFHVLPVATFGCPCCGYVVHREYRGWEICPICFWEDGGLMEIEDNDFICPANSVSLKEAQRNYLKFGASSEESLSSVRLPDAYDIKDSNHTTLD